MQKLLQAGCFEDHRLSWKIGKTSIELMVEGPSCYSSRRKLFRGHLKLHILFSTFISLKLSKHASIVVVVVLFIYFFGGEGFDNGVVFPTPTLAAAGLYLFVVLLSEQNRTVCGSPTWLVYMCCIFLPQLYRQRL